MSDYDNIPSKATIKLNKFSSKIPDSDLEKLKQLIDLSPIGPETYENLREDGVYGVSRKWLIETRDHWSSKYDWRDVESELNSYPQYKVDIKARDGDTYPIHFIGLFSKKADAKPLCCMHGWPGSILEFLPYLKVVKERWSPEELPWHIVVPSLPGYTYSGGPSTKSEWTNEDMAYCMNEVMVGLGLSGYIAHGGDIGSFLSRICAVRYDACRAMNLNFYLMPAEPKGVDASEVTDTEKKQLQRLAEFGTYGNAYAKEHGTKGGTIGLVLSASPLALLCWIGEKFQAWTDTTPSTKSILDSVTLYWLTQTFPRAIYPYIDFFGRGDASTVFHEHADYHCKKPMGYSYFPMELGPIPVAWARTSGNLIWYRRHESGGHFAAMEKPEELVQDMVDFIKELDGQGKEMPVRSKA